VAENLSFPAVRTNPPPTSRSGEAWRWAEQIIALQAAPPGATVAGAVTAASVGRKLSVAASIDASAMSGFWVADRPNREHIFPACNS